MEGEIGFIKPDQTLLFWNNKVMQARFDEIKSENKLFFIDNQTKQKVKCRL